MRLFFPFLSWTIPSCFSFMWTTKVLSTSPGYACPVSVRRTRLSPTSAPNNWRETTHTAVQDHNGRMALSAGLSDADLLRDVASQVGVDRVAADDELLEDRAAPRAGEIQLDGLLILRLVPKPTDVSKPLNIVLSPSITGCAAATRRFRMRRVPYMNQISK